MSLAIVYSRASQGIQAPLVTVEVHLSNGMAGLHIVGLPEAAVKESKDRVRSAIMNTHFEFPIRRITVNLAPADLPKEGGRFDLPIALGILAASAQIPKNKLMDYEFTGELALSGELRFIRGILPIVLGTQATGRQLIIPEANAKEAGIVRSQHILAAKHILEVTSHLCGKTPLAPCSEVHLEETVAAVDMAEVKGQVHAKRALEIAAAGRHSLLFIGPPGTGKTMLATRISGILPPLTDIQALEVASLASVSSGGFDFKQWKKIPFRSPHHSSSHVALVGGGRPPRPGEISLAHHGTLFLDELPEYTRRVLESLREPLESGEITISRAAIQAQYPAAFQLLAAMNPCPCGYAGSTLRECQCSLEQVKRYMARISGPLLDRIDMHVEVGQLPPEALTKLNTFPSETSEKVRERVIAARNEQILRQGKVNALLTVTELEKHAELEHTAEQLLMQVMTRFNLSARVYHRILKVARTMADLGGSETVQEQHISEALGFRCLDRMQRESILG